MIKVTMSAKNETVVLNHAEGLPDRVTRACALGLGRGLLHIAQIAQRRYLMGPRPARLGIRTGRLVRSITTAVMTFTRRVVGTLGVLGSKEGQIPYAGFHEFGFHGIQHVRAHTRAIKQMNAAGESIDLRRKIFTRKGEFVGFRDSMKRASRAMKTGSVGVQFVKAHERRIEYAGRPYLGPALAQGMPVVLSEMIKELGTIK